MKVETSVEDHTQASSNLCVARGEVLLCPSALDSEAHHQGYRYDGTVGQRDSCRIPVSRNLGGQVRVRQEQPIGHLPHDQKEDNAHGGVEPEGHQVDNPALEGPGEAG